MSKKTKGIVSMLLTMIGIVSLMMVQPIQTANAQEENEDVGYEFTTRDTVTINQEDFSDNIEDGRAKKLQQVKKVIINCGVVCLDDLSCFPNVETIKISKNTSLNYVEFFHHCSFPALKEIVVDPKNPEYANYHGGLYTKSLKTLLLYPTLGNPEVTLSKKTKEISRYAFEEAPITKINIPDGLVTIREGAFAHTKLKQITLPASLSVVEEDILLGTDIKKLKIAKNNKHLCSIDNVIYTKDRKRLVYWPDMYAVENMVLPDELVKLDCSMIHSNSIKIPKNLTTIENAKDNLLQTVQLSKNNKHFTIYDGVLYSSDGKEICLYPSQNKDTEIELNPKLVTLSMEHIPMGNTTTILTLPASLKMLEGEGSFDDPLFEEFTNLSELKLKRGNKYFSVKDGVLFNKKMTFLLWFPIDLDCKEYKIPDTVKMIENQQLVRQNHIEKLIIPKHCKLFDYSQVEFTDDFYFVMPVGRECFNLKEFTVADNNPYYTVEEGVLFSKDMRILLAYPDAKTDKSYTIPTSVGDVPFGNYNPYLEILNVSKNVYNLGGSSYRDYQPFDCDGFLHYTALREINIDPENEDYVSIDGVVYRDIDDIGLLPFFHLKDKESE